MDTTQTVLSHNDSPDIPFRYSLNPDRAEKVMNRLRAHRNGQVNDQRFGHRMRTTGPWANVLKHLFRTACATTVSISVSRPSRPTISSGCAAAR